MQSLLEMNKRKKKRKKKKVTQQDLDLLSLLNNGDKFHSFRFLLRILFTENAFDYEDKYVYSQHSFFKALCPCQLDPSHTGLHSEEAFPILQGFKKQIVEIIEQGQLTQEEGERMIDEFKKHAIFGGDPLHIFIGFPKCIFDYLVNDRKIIKQKVLKKFQNEIHKKGIGSFKGFHWRQFICGYDIFVTDCLVDQFTKKDQLSRWFEYIAEIQCISYAPAIWQKNAKVRVRLWVIVFLFSELIANNVLFDNSAKTKLLNNYSHQILFHFPHLYETIPLCYLCTERTEREMASLNKITSNNQIIDTMVNWMTKSQENLQNKSDSRSGKKKNLIDQWTKSKTWLELSIKKNEESKALIKAMKLYGHQESEWQENEKYYIFPSPFQK